MENKTCPQCHNPNCDSDGRFCWNCGLELGNCCDNPECESDGVTDTEEEILILPDEYSYCPYCGIQTRYARLGFAQQIVFEPQA